MNFPNECVRIDSAHTSNFSLPMIEFKIGNKEGKALIDTGATVNIISKNIAQNIRNSKHVIGKEQCNLKVIGITNTEMIIEEKIRIKIKLNDKILEVNFFVNEIEMRNYDAILGVEFLVGNNISIDCKQKKMFNQSFEVNWIRQYNQWSENVEINSSETDEIVVGYNTRKQIVPPKSELIIPVHTLDIKLNSDLVLVQPSKTSINNSWVISGSVNNYNANGNYFIKVANFSDDPIHINKNTKLVLIEPIDPILQTETVVNVIEKDFESDYDLFGGQFDLSHLNDGERSRVEALLKQHSNIFAKSVKQLTGCKTVKHRVYLTDDIPIRQKPYRTPHPLKEELKTQIEDLLDAGIISVSDSPYAFPIILVKKKK